jgi:hypothetical protein
VELDADVVDLEMQPLPGKLLRLRGNVAGCPPQERFLRVTLAFDSGRRETNAPCPLGAYFFDGLPPATYEILATPGTVTPVTTAAYEEAFFDRDAVVNLQLTELPVLGLRTERPDQTPLKPGEFTVRLRRRDLAGSGEFVAAGLVLPGYYELFFQTSGPDYVQQVSLFPDRKRIQPQQPPRIAPLVHMPQSARTNVTVRVSSQSATVEGVVKQQGRISIFAPVYLYPIDAELSRRMNGSRATYTDEAGRFRFSGIAPGRYWIISTIDLEEISNVTLEHARADELLLQESDTKQIELTMYEVR